MKVVHKVPIVFATNDLYIIPLCVAIASLKENRATDTEYSIYVLYESLQEHSQKMLYILRNKCVEISLIKIDRFVSVRIEKSNTYITKETFFRFCLPTLFTQYDKVLYLDCDILVQKDLYQLYSEDIGEYYAGVVTDIDPMKRLEHLKIAHRGYFNAGVMLFNLNRMREDNVEEILLSYPMDYQYLDQDVLNIVLGKNVRYLSGKYNFQITTLLRAEDGDEIFKRDYQDSEDETLQDFLKEASILHLTSAYKPWIYEIPKVSELYMGYYTLIEEMFKKPKLLPICDFRGPDYPSLIYSFPKIDSLNGNRIVLYGADLLGKAYFQEIMQNKDLELVLWIDGKAAYYRGLGLPVDDVVSIKKCEFDVVCVAVRLEKTFEEIKENLIAMGIAESKIMWQLTPEKKIKKFTSVLQDYKNRWMKDMQ